MHTANQRILLSVPHVAGTETAYVQEAFQSNWLSSVGPNIDAFENAFQQKIGLPCLALSSGTAAVHLGLRILGVGPGDEVLCPTLTFAATCNPVRYLGAEPVFVDSEESTWNLDANLVEKALKERAAHGRLPRALVVVHLYGQCADMDPILEICRRYGVRILEDAAQALGAKYKGHHAGTMGDAGAFSFNGNKIITTTGGGMLVSTNAAWLEKARFWSQQARDPGLAYEHSELGYNYRMSNVLAGIGRGQLEVLDLRVRQRRAIAFRYRDAFADLPGIRMMPQANHGVPTNWLSCFLIDEKEFGCSRDELIRVLDEANVESRPAWKPMHLQPFYAGSTCYGGSVAEHIFHRGICLPSSSSLSEADQLFVINTIRRAAGARVLAAKETALLTGESGCEAAIEDSRISSPAPVITTHASSTGSREIPMSDLLGRPPVHLMGDSVSDTIRERVVLITGAAGSIGSELCRQVARLGPAAVVGFDVAETPLFEIDLEMRREFPSIPFFAEIGSILSPARLDEVLKRHRPSVIYHAAAYKHVSLMEDHPFEAVENNALGTCNLALAAQAHGVDHFVLISSDKAVRPASVMGVSKRIAELAIMAMQNGPTRFVAVRFGNVLDSNGSVVQIFRKQIAAGGPVTVTDAEMRRFFMTIPEACQLVLQAAAIGGGGQICVLNMGQPIKIVDLARNMIVRSGLNPDEDIRIEFTGIRPGEKLHEELSTLLEDTVPTHHDQIRMLIGAGMDELETGCRINSLRAICKQRDLRALVGAMRQFVPEFIPSSKLLERLEEGTSRGETQQAAPQGSPATGCRPE